MTAANKTREELISEVETLQVRVSELERSKKVCRRALLAVSEKLDQDFPQMDHRDEAVFVVFDRKLEFVNDRFVELFCVSPEDACSGDFNPMALIAPESRPLIREQYKEGSRGTYTTTQFEFTGLTNDGRKIECEAMIIFIPYKWGTAMQGTLRDISVQTKINEASQRLNGDFRSTLNTIPSSGFYGDLQLNAL